MDNHEISLAQCPACGYDLRAAHENRCSECGRSFNPADLNNSWMPWERTCGLVARTAAWFKTVWTMTFGPKSLLLEEKRDHNYKASVWFRRLVSLVYIVSAAVVLGYAWKLFNLNLIDSAILKLNQAIDNTGAPVKTLDKWLMQFELILGFGLKGQWVLWLVLGMVGYELSVWPGRLAHVRKAPEDRKVHLKALGNYLSAPLLGVMLMGWVWMGLKFWSFHTSDAMRNLLKYFYMGASIACGLMFLLFVWRGLQWKRRVKGVGLIRGVFEIVLWMIDLAGRLILWLAMVPIYVGYLRMMWES